MNTNNQVKLAELLKTFNSGFEIHEFHSEWNLFLNTLTKAERTFAVQSLMDSMLENAQTFRKEAIEFAESGTDQDRQTVLNMVSDLKEHPFFTRKEAKA
jgi:ABC-type Zn2+ transport system substrate-binding protein/surface adhesin